LGVFAKLRKAIISFFMSLCPSARLSVRMEQQGSRWTDFFFGKYVENFQNFFETRQE
jgi:hypothetical protein